MDVELTEKLVAAIKDGKYDTIICNYANPDMVGHTGNYEATIKAVRRQYAALNRSEPVIANVSPDQDAQAQTVLTASGVYDIDGDGRTGEEEEDSETE